MFRLPTLLAITMIVTAAALPVSARQEARPQWLAVLSLARPELRDPAAWTSEDGAKMTAHFNYHSSLARQGVVIFGGRTQHRDPDGRFPGDGMGLVVFEADGRAAAEAVMAADPAVAGNVLTVRVLPYRIAFQRAPSAGVNP